MAPHTRSASGSRDRVDVGYVTRDGGYDASGWSVSGPEPVEREGYANA